MTQAGSQFRAARGMRNPHLQTILSSVGPRRWIVRRAFDSHREQQQELVLQCHDGVRLTGFYNQAGERAGQHLTIIIHGWEGSADSSYVLSMTARLLRNGIDVFRLNLRDHGDTHHLNEGLFNSTLVPEVVSAIEEVQRQFPHQDNTLVGFSLGGNFALRVAAQAFGRQVSLQRVVAFCPAIHAATSNRVLNTPANFVYGQYFVRKWKKSLRKKLAHFPAYEYADELDQLKTLDEMNRRLIPRYTEYEDVEKYFDAYAITGEVLAKTVCPCYLHFARDDMIIPWQDVKRLAENPDLHVTITEHGGHCGYISNWRFDSWQDERVLQLIRA